MDTGAMQMFSAMLALAALAGAVVLMASMTVGRGSTAGGEIVRVARENAMRLALLLAGASMLGSLYFSEIADYAPCKLCWYQRICMYGIALVSLVAVVRRERVAAPYVTVLASVGLVISAYHYLVEWFPRLESDVCSLDVPCTTIWFRTFGFVTLPFMAGAAFLSVIVVMAAERKR
ncbi:MAG: disulfide bond formation protein B [Actinomycetota bacterium]